MCDNLYFQYGRKGVQQDMTPQGKVWMAVKPHASSATKHAGEGLLVNMPLQSTMLTSSNQAAVSHYQQLARRYHSKSDTSVDVYFGPVPPAGKKANWIQIIPGKGCGSLF